MPPPNESAAQSLREDLYRVVYHYAELTDLAKKGEIDPLGQISKILKNTAPYLLLVIRDILPRLERGELTYHEALYYLLSAARDFSDHDLLMTGRHEIEKIEAESRVFLYAVKWLDSHSLVKPSIQETDAIKTKLNILNEKYRKRYATPQNETATMIPYFLPREESESTEVGLARVADLVGRAILELHHLMVEREPEKSFFVFPSQSRKDMEDELINLAWFLFRCGYTVDRIARGYYRDLLAVFLNEKILDYLIANADSVDTLQGISTHLYVISLLDCRHFYELSIDYRALEDTVELGRQIRTMKNKKRRGVELIRKAHDLYKLYGSKPQGKLVQNFLLYRYYLSFGDYHGEHKIRDARVGRAIDLYKSILDLAAMEERAEADLKKSMHGFSSKTTDEMSALIKLIMDSLHNPGKVSGRKVKVLGDISSGAMGKVSIGIHRNRIVALKKVKTQVPASLGDPVLLLKYEAALHARVQTPEQHPLIVEYYGLIEQDAELLLINGYYPNDNLTDLVEKNWQQRYKPPFVTESKITLATLEVVINQLLQCLRLFRERGVVHRDLKTDNILYTVDETERLNRLKIIDFGVALAVGASPVDDIFKGKVVGTFAYMAPEQARGRSGFQSDLYSVGAIIAVLISGKLPMLFPKTHDRKELMKQLSRIEKEPRAKMTDQNPFLKKNNALEYISVMVDRMLELDPEKRPSLEEAQAAFNSAFSDLGPQKSSIGIFYHRG